MSVDVAAAKRFADEDLAGKVQGYVRGTSREAAEDAVQDAWVVLTRKAELLEEDGNLRGWLLRTATNVARQRREKARTRGEGVSIDEFDDGGEFLQPRDTAAVDEIDARLTLDALPAIVQETARLAETTANGLVAASGDVHPASTVTDAQVAEVRHLFAANTPSAEIAERVGLSRLHVDQIRRGRSRASGSFRWTGERVIAALRAFHYLEGRTPLTRDIAGRPYCRHCSPSRASSGRGTARFVLQACPSMRCVPVIATGRGSAAWMQSLSSGASTALADATRSNRCDRWQEKRTREAAAALPLARHAQQSLGLRRRCGQGGR